MKVVVINGSPKGEQSDTMKLTRAFLKGLHEDYEVINTIEKDIKYCRGCYGCWYHTPGRCVQQDDMSDILEKITASDLVIWSMPLYCYGMPANVKAVVDRLLPLNCPEQHIGKDGNTHHSSRIEHEIKMMLISGCGFPDRKGNYDALIWQFERMFGKGSPMILCVEEPLLSIDEAAPLASVYLENVQRAGEEYIREGKITEETKRVLDAPMFPPEQYRSMAGK